MYNNLRRFLALVFAFVVFYAGFKTEKLLYWSLMLVAAGEAIRIWAAGYIKKNKVLSIVGPYKYVRNPLYLGSFLIGLGFGIFINNFMVFAAITIVFLYIYTLKINSEERKLEEIFGAQYLEYKRNAGRWLPLKKFNMTIAPDTVSGNKFSLKLAVINNKEYNAVLGCVLSFPLLFF